MTDLGTEAEREVCWKICDFSAMACRESRSECRRIRVWIAIHPGKWREINSNGERQSREGRGPDGRAAAFPSPKKVNAVAPVNRG